MSLRINAQADMLQRPATGFNRSLYSLTGFGQLVVNRGDYSTFTLIERAGPVDYCGIQTAANGVELLFVRSEFTLLTGPVLTVGTWYFIGATYNVALNRSAFYVGNADTGAAFTTVTGDAAITQALTTINVGSDSFSEFVNGNMAGWTYWNKELLAADMTAQRARLNPLASSMPDVNGFYPLLTDAQKLVDFGPNGIDLTPAGVGPWTTAANPLQPWVIDEPAAGAISLVWQPPTVSGGGGGGGWTGTPVITSLGAGIARITGVSLGAGAIGTIGLYGSGADIELPSYFLSSATPTLNLSDLIEADYQQSGGTANFINVDKSEGPFTLTFTNTQGSTTGQLEIYVKYHHSLER